MKRFDEFIESITEVRATNPHLISQTMAKRQRRPLLSEDGRLFILAADHPARGALGVGADDMAMANRHELLRRLRDALANPKVDGFLGTPDLVEDLSLLGALEGKIVVGSMNRGGLKGADFEMDDKLTGYDARSIQRACLDFAKLLLRINLSDGRSLKTLKMATKAVNRCAKYKIPLMIEPFMSNWVDGSIQNDLSTNSVIKSVAIASALGATSAFSWLKLPLVNEMERVLQSTSLPVLLLGGDPKEGDGDIFARWEAALSLRGVRGLVVGRSLLYPRDGDVMGAVERAASLVHR